MCVVDLSVFFCSYGFASTWRTYASTQTWSTVQTHPGCHGMHVELIPRCNVRYCSSSSYDSLVLSGNQDMISVQCFSYGHLGAPWLFADERLRCR